MSKQFIFAAILGFSALSMAVPSAEAGQLLEIEVDESQIMTLPSTPGAIVIGNPAIADVSIQGQKIFVHGRGFGQTNLTILDLQGNQIANFNVVGKQTKSSALALFRGPDRYSYSCATYCEAEAQIGDQQERMLGILAQNSAKIELATGNKTAEATAPQAPQ
jgi:Pilus formation protein N terminal region